MKLFFLPKIFTWNIRITSYNVCYTKLLRYVVFKLFTMSLKKLKNRSAIAVTTGAAHGGISITIQLSGEKESFAKLLDDETTGALVV